MCRKKAILRLDLFRIVYVSHEKNYAISDEWRDLITFFRRSQFQCYKWHIYDRGHILFLFSSQVISVRGMRTVKRDSKEKQELEYKVASRR